MLRLESKILTIRNIIGEKKKVCQKWDSNPRPQRGPELLV